MSAVPARGRVMPLQHFECSVWSLVMKRSGWDGVYPQRARDLGVQVWHKTVIQEGYDSAKSMVAVAGQIISELREHGATFKQPAGGAAC